MPPRQPCLAEIVQARTIAELEDTHEGGADMASTRIDRPENLFEEFDPSDYDR